MRNFQPSYGSEYFSYEQRRQEEEKEAQEQITQQTAGLSPTERGAVWRSTLLADRQKKVLDVFNRLDTQRRAEIENLSNSFVPPEYRPKNTTTTQMLLHRLSADPNTVGWYFAWIGSGGVGDSTTQQNTRKTVIRSLGTDWRKAYVPPAVGEEISLPPPIEVPEVSIVPYVVGGLLFFGVLGGILFYVRTRQTEEE